jgi:hypothetical protein
MKLIKSNLNSCRPTGNDAYQSWQKRIMATVIQAFLCMRTNRNYKFVTKDKVYDFVHNVRDLKLKISLYGHVCKF